MSHQSVVFTLFSQYLCCERRPDATLQGIPALRPRTRFWVFPRRVIGIAFILTDRVLQKSVQVLNLGLFPQVVLVPRRTPFIVGLPDQAPFILVSSHCELHIEVTVFTCQTATNYQFRMSNNVERAATPYGFFLRRFTSVMIAGLNQSVARANNDSRRSQSQDRRR